MLNSCECDGYLFASFVMLTLGAVDRSSCISSFSKLTIVAENSAVPSNSKTTLMA
jgi:hypothetical protein